MARPSFKGRQLSLYARSIEDVERWKKICKPSTLNGWILELIDRELEKDAPATKIGTDINVLRKENLDLKQENIRLKARVTEIEKASKIPAPSPLDPNAVEFLASRGVIKSAAQSYWWLIVDAITGKEKRIESPSKEEITKFKDSLGYTSIRIIEKDDASKTVVIRPRDRAGGLDLMEIRTRRARNVSSTLEQLEAMGLVKNTQRGYVWTK
jgi:hypothetical protein